MGCARTSLALLTAWWVVGATPATGQSAGVRVDFGVGLSMATGNHDARKSGIRFEAGTDAVALGGGVRLGLQASAGLHPGGADNYCVTSDRPRNPSIGGAGFDCRTNFPSFVLLAPEVRWPLNHEVRVSLGSGPWWGTDQGVRVAAQAGLDLAGAISHRSAVLLSARVLTAPRRGERSITSFGIVLGLQRRFRR